MRCPRCGADNPEGNTYCGLCYQRFSSGPASTTPEGPGVPAAGDPSLPVNAYPSSDVYAVPAPPPVETKASAGRRRGPGALTIVIVVALVVGVGVGAYFLVSHFAGGTQEYSSGLSGLSFEYPKGWETADLDAGSGPLGTIAGSSAYNEVVVADGSVADAGNILGIRSMKDRPESEWEQMKSYFQSRLQQTLMAKAPGVSQPTYTETAVAGKPAFSVRFRIPSVGGDFDMDITGVYSGSTIYEFVFCTREGATGAAEFKKILDSAGL